MKVVVVYCAFYLVTGRNASRHATKMKVSWRAILRAKMVFASFSLVIIFISFDNLDTLSPLTTCVL